jgi:hypothetical protein
MKQVRFMGEQKPSAFAEYTLVCKLRDLFTELKDRYIHAIHTFNAFQTVIRDKRVNDKLVTAVRPFVSLSGLFIDVNQSINDFLRFQESTTFSEIVKENKILLPVLMEKSNIVSDPCTLRSRPKVTSYDLFVNNELSFMGEVQVKKQKTNEDEIVHHEFLSIPEDKPIEECKDVEPPTVKSFCQISSLLGEITPEDHSFNLNNEH